MSKYLKLTSLVVILITVVVLINVYQASAQTCSSGNCTAASTSTTDVQNCINSTTEGNTCTIPPGTSSWTSGVTISGKGIRVQGSGAGRVIAVDVESSAIPIGTGSKTFSGVTNDMGATAYLSATAPPITTGETLLIYENGFLANYLEGTVTSFSGSTLVMNITSAGGTCGTVVPNAMNSNCKRWLITTLPSTVIQNNLTSGSMFTITEDTAVHTTVSGIQFAQGSGGGGVAEEIYLTRNNPNGIAILVHDNFFQSNQADLIDGDTNRGVIWNNSFVFSPFSEGQFAAIRIKDANNAMSTSWSSPALWGSLDTTGQAALYFETNDVHADGAFTDNDDNGRLVVRYNVLDNAGGATHGADTSAIGMRTMEYYNNAGIFEAYSDGSTANMNWWMYVRGGTLVWHDNTLPALSSGDWGSKSDLVLIEMTLQREDQYPCWGAGFSTPGQYYPAPRQIGFGYVTGSGTVTYPPLGYNSASTTANGVYVGDSEPVYIWNNSRSMNLGIQDYGLGITSSCPSSPTPDSVVNYLISGRDYFNGTAKPGYTPYTYPNPLASSGTTYTWTPTIVGSGSLSGSNCGSGSYSSGATIGACTASPSGGYTFTGWSSVSGSAACSGSTNPCPSFSITANSAATATFTASSSPSPAAGLLLLTSF